MSDISRREFLNFAAIGIGGAALTRRAGPDAIDVRSFGAAGDGITLDTAAVNRAIAAAARAGGGVVRFPRGTYACHSIRLRSGVTLALERGATILAAPPGGYDAAEPNPWEQYQDFGHNHFHNSLIWGEGLHDVAILGPGLIWGKGLCRDTIAINGMPSALTPGSGNKAIALKNCVNVTLRDFSVLEGGHFAILATGVDDLVIDKLSIDTNRDGIDIDCCRRVRIRDCRVNSPHDDSICLKSSFALGYPRATEEVVVSDCYVTGGYRIGALLDGSYERLPGGEKWVEARQCMMGRIKLGSESNGGFRNIRIENCICELCLGLAFEAVDGGDLENVLVRGVTMRDIRGAPIFLRLGARLRGPRGTAVGALRGIAIDGLTSRGPDTMPAIVSGIPGHRIAAIALRDVALVHEGGGSTRLAGLVPPEAEPAYPEIDMFGALPAQGLFARHVRGLELSRVAFASLRPDPRPIVWLNDVTGTRFSKLRLPEAAPTPAVLRF
jgi:polygalacturonase